MSVNHNWWEQAKEVKSTLCNVCGSKAGEESHVWDDWKKRWAGKIQSMFMAKCSPQTHSWCFFLIRFCFWGTKGILEASLSLLNSLRPASILIKSWTSLLVSPLVSSRLIQSTKEPFFPNLPGVHHIQFERRVSKQGVKQGGAGDSCYQHVTGFQIPFPLPRKSNSSMHVLKQVWGSVNG